MLDATSGFNRNKVDESSEIHLLRELKAHSREAWARVYDDCYPKLYGYFWATTASNAEADDVVAATFSRALTAIDSYSYQGRPLLAWLFQIAKNVLSERRRKLQREIPLASFVSLAGSPDLDVILEAHHASRSEHEPDVVARLDLVNAIGNLSREQQEVILLRHISGLSVLEVAEILRKSTRAVYYLEARALVRLKDSLR